MGHQLAPRSPATGQPLTRLEDRALLTGRATFTADVIDPLLRDATHIAFARSPVAAGTINRIDVTDAVSMPGVVGALTGADYSALAPYSLFGDDFAQPLLPTSEVSFSGQAVAAIVAETMAQAIDAAEMVEVDIEARQPMLDLGAALASPESVLEATRFASAPRDDSPFLAAEVVVEVENWSPRQLPSPIEGRAVAAIDNDGQLMVWAATQTPHAFRANLAKLLELDPASVRVVAPEVGGGFGGKVGRTAEEYLVPVMARRLGRPVRWQETRSEYFATATQGRGEQISLQLAGTRDGRITALRAHLVKDGGAFPLVGVLLAEGYGSKVANGCYDIAHTEFSSIAVRTNRPPTSAYRGAGRSPYIAALERTVDVFASEIGLDPAEVRRRNLIRPQDMPYQTPTGATYDEADYPADLERALDVVGYSDLRAAQAARRNVGDPMALGIGMASYNHMTVGGGGEEAAVTVRADGSALVVTGTTSQGHGHATTWAQIASDVLGIDVAHIEVIEGDTAAIATGVGAVGSRSLQTAGLAIHRASNQVVQQAKQLAAELLEASVDDIVQANDGTGFHVIGTPSRTVTWQEIVEKDPDDELSCGDFYDTNGRNTFPSGAHVAVVEVEIETGQVVLRRLVAVDDAGTVVNPLIVEGQIHGGIASAAGQVLGEVVVHDDAGNQLTSTFLDYPIPTADQLPSFEVRLSATPSSFNTLGFKGIGESGTVGATGAIHNAVVDAISHLGVRHLDLPCTPRRIWEALQESSALHC